MGWWKDLLLINQRFLFYHCKFFFIYNDKKSIHFYSSLFEFNKNLNYTTFKKYNLFSNIFTIKLKFMVSSQVPDLTLMHTTVNLLSVVADLSGYSYVLLKIYRLFCYTKLTFDQMPLFNPYRWPLSLMRVITTPYFRFWSILLPPIRLGRASYDLSAVVSLELLNSLIYFFLQLRYGLLAQMESLLSSSTIP